MNKPKLVKETMIEPSHDVSEDQRISIHNPEAEAIKGHIKNTIEEAFKFDGEVTLANEKINHYVEIYFAWYALIMDYYFFAGAKNNTIPRKDLNQFLNKALKNYDDLDEEKQVLQKVLNIKINPSWAVDVRKKMDVRLKQKLTANKNNTLLIIAAILNKPDVIYALLNAGADPSIRNEQNRTLADLTNNEEILKTLAKKGLLPDSVNWLNPIFLKILLDDIEKHKSLPNYFNRQLNNIDSFTLRLVEKINQFKRERDNNQKQSSIKLFFLITDTFNLLPSEFVFIYQEDPFNAIHSIYRIRTDNQDTFEYAVKTKDEAKLNNFFAEKKNFSWWHQTIMLMYGNEEMLKAWHESYIKHNHSEPEYSPLQLIYVIKNKLPFHFTIPNALATYRMPIDDGRIFNIRKGDTLLHIAARFDNTDAIKLLKERGADINAANDKKNTPLHVAAHKGNLAAVKQFASYDGCAIHAVNEIGNTPLGLACFRDNLADHDARTSVALFLIQQQENAPIQKNGYVSHPWYGCSCEHHREETPYEILCRTLSESLRRKELLQLFDENNEVNKNPEAMEKLNLHQLLTDDMITLLNLCRQKKGYAIPIPHAPRVPAIIVEEDEEQEDFGDTKMDVSSPSRHSFFKSSPSSMEISSPITPPKEDESPGYSP